MEIVKVLLGKKKTKRESKLEEALKKQRMAVAVARVEIVNCGQDAIKNFMDGREQQKNG